MKTTTGICLALLLTAGCSTPYRTSARFFQGKMNMVTRAPAGTVVSVLNYCGQHGPCPAPQVEVVWGSNGELKKINVDYPTTSIDGSAQP